jgi:hypothetical protein
MGWDGTRRDAMRRHGTARHGTVRHARHGTARDGTARDGTSVVGRRTRYSPPVARSGSALPCVAGTTVPRSPLSFRAHVASPTRNVRTRTRAGTARTRARARPSVCIQCSVCVLRCEHARTHARTVTHALCRTERSTACRPVRVARCTLRGARCVLHAATCGPTPQPAGGPGAESASRLFGLLNRSAERHTHRATACGVPWGHAPRLPIGGASIRSLWRGRSRACIPRARRRCAARTSRATFTPARGSRPATVAGRSAQRTRAGRRVQG